MDRQTIQAIATEVAKQLPTYSWTTLIIQVALTAAVAAVAAYLGAYFKKRGEHLATKADFEEALQQSGVKTQLAETIKETVKSEFARRDWASREWANLRRVKLEELLGKASECREYLDQHMKAAYARQELPKGDPINDLETIARLYFPELKDETQALIDLHKLRVVEGRKLQAFFNNNGDEVGNKYRSEYAGKWAVSFEKDLPALSEKLTAAARELLEKILGVQAR